MPTLVRIFSAWLFCAVSVCAQNVDPQKLFQQAIAAQQGGDNATAIRIYQGLLRDYPETVVVRVNLGALFAQLQRFDESIQQYRAVLLSDPDNLPVRLNLALAYQEKGDVGRATSELEFVHKRQPDNLQASMLLADCYLRLQRYSEAILIAAPLESSLPDDLDLAWVLGSALIHSGRASEGLQRIDKVAAKAHSADAFFLAGETRLQRDDYDLARRDEDAAYQLNPALPGVLTLKGMILEHTGDYEGAEAALNAALKANSQDFNARYFLGAILYFKRDLAGARTQSAQARYELALVARAEGKSEEALRELEMATRRNPSWIQPHIELSTLYYRLNRPDDGAREREIVDRLQAAHA